MNFINKIGQRNCAKILILIAGCSGFLGFVLKNTTDLKGVALGLFLFILPSLILSFTANKNKDYRLFSLIASFILIIINNILFFADFTLILFLVLVIEVITSTIFYIFIHKLESKKRLIYKNQKRKVKLSSNNKENNLSPDTEIANNV